MKRIQLLLVPNRGRYVTFNSIIVFVLIMLDSVLVAQNIDSLLNRIYYRAIQQQNAHEKMGDYSYLQSVHFIKRDGDGDIEEQSKRVFRAYVRPPDFQKRVLISAQNYTDEIWEDVTAAEKNKDRKSESQQFSLTEMVSPEVRTAYLFTLISMNETKDDSVLHFEVQAVKKNADRFDGELWFRAKDYVLTKAKLKPSETPTGIDSMRMHFELQSVGNYWLPANVYIEAYISFLFFFKGSIQTTIDFSDYRLDQVIPDGMFSNDP